MKDIRNYSLLAHNTFGIDAKCSRFLEYESVEEARQMVGVLTEADQPLLILGGGSNLLLTGDYAGTVLHSAIMGIEVLDNKTLAAAEGDDALCNPDWVFLSCGSGEVFDDDIVFNLFLLRKLARIELRASSLVSLVSNTIGKVSRISLIATYLIDFPKFFK